VAGVKHPATDPLNALLSFTYTLLMNEVSGCWRARDWSRSWVSAPVDYGRPSLALDIVEAFRHPVADRFVLRW